MVKAMGGTLIARKVDCTIVHYDDIDMITGNRPILEDSTEEETEAVLFLTSNICKKFILKIMI